MPIKSVFTVRCIGPGRESSCRSPLIYRTIFRKYVGDEILSLHPATCEEDLAKCVDTMKGNIDVKAVMCTRMKSKYESRPSRVRCLCEVLLLATSASTSPPFT